jgi:integrase
VSAGERFERLETARGCCDQQGLDRLWAGIPERMRLSCFTAGSVPADYVGAFCPGLPHGGVDLAGLPGPMRTEVAWCVYRIIELGGKIPTPAFGMLVHRLQEVVTDLGHDAPCSLLELSGRAWCQKIALAVHTRTGRLPAASTTANVRGLLAHMTRLLTVALDTRPWWQHELWNPLEDNRIPVRAHEPMGRFSVRFDRVATPWLRLGLQWHCKVGLQTGSLRWSSVHHRVVAVGIFDAFIRDRQTDGPQLAGEPAQVRALMLDFLGHLRATKASRGPRKGQPLSLASVQRLAGDVEQFYLSMADNQDTAAAALGEPGWLHLGPEHTRFYRRGELPGRQCPDLERDVIDEAALSQIMAGLGLLGAPVAEGGFGDEQAMRITMLQALLGRRINEICLLDRDPLLPLARSTPTGQADPLAAVARLRYQQTKIDGAPDTVPVHAEVVAIVRAQQEWADRYFSEHGAPGRTPKYLFLGASMNRNGDRPYPAGSLRPLLSELALRLDVRDSTGRLVDFNRTHRFRHTVATSLLNAGVAIHVVQRYLGHLSPTMTMHYAKTLQSTAEAEFLRYRKLNACAHDVDIDPQDLYDLLQLDKRTDRVLPNGYCLLAPRQVCGKGNACLVCDKLATDATFLPELKTQRQATLQLIEQRQAAFLARTGAPMDEQNVWLAGRRLEHDALAAIITEIEKDPGSPGSPRVVRGAGTTTRTDAVTHRKDTP